MAEYIIREQAKQAIYEYILSQTMSKYPSAELCKASRMGAEGAMYELDYIPTADVEEVKHGEWVHTSRGFDVSGDYECSVCQSPSGIKHFYNGKKYSFCPDCGAKMDGKGDT